MKIINNSICPKQAVHLLLGRRLLFSCDGILVQSLKLGEMRDHIHPVIVSLR